MTIAVDMGHNATKTNKQTILPENCSQNVKVEIRKNGHFFDQILKSTGKYQKDIKTKDKYYHSTKDIKNNSEGI